MPIRLYALIRRDRTGDLVGVVALIGAGLVGVEGDDRVVQGRGAPLDIESTARDALGEVIGDRAVDDCQ